MLSDHPHFRFNPLINEWVLVSPHRAKRPWKGKLEDDDHNEDKVMFDKNNPLCPGAVRSNGLVNSFYKSTFVFDNDFPALYEDVPSPNSDNFFFQMKSAKGRCRVICFHPNSNLTLPLMSLEEIKKVIQTWIDESIYLSDHHDWIQIFENKGDIMGCSNPHPHCQIWTSTMPNEPFKKDVNQKEYFAKNGRPLLMDYLDQEVKAQKRIVIENTNWVVLTPFWAVWPFETMILPKQHVTRIQNLNANQIDDLAHIMKKLLIKYDNIFETSFPYTMGWQGIHLMCTVPIE